MKKTIKSLIFLTIAAVMLLPAGGCREKTPRMFYEIKIYDVSGPGQAERTEKYISGALKPVLRRSGIEGVGVFKPVEADTADAGKYVYVFIPYETADKYFSMKVVLEKDADYQKRAGDFLNASTDDPPFQRYESILLKAFEGMPRFRAPSFDTDRQERIYELRSYESATEHKAGKKIDMFNNEEIALFEKLKFNAVFYGQVLSGSHMPNLMYMTTFQNMETHDEKWEEFRNDPDWIRMRDMEEYRNTVSKNTQYLLYPTSYSDF